MIIIIDNDNDTCNNTVNTVRRESQHVSKLLSISLSNIDQFVLKLAKQILLLLLQRCKNQRKKL